jgi:hypothetical protein
VLGDAITHDAQGQFIEQEPAPRGSPHEPQACGAGADTMLPPRPTANAESRLCNDVLSQDGQTGVVLAWTSNSKSLRHSRHSYS